MACPRRFSKRVWRSQSSAKRTGGLSDRHVAMFVKAIIAFVDQVDTVQSVGANVAIHVGMLITKAKSCQDHG